MRGKSKHTIGKQTPIPTPYVGDTTDVFMRCFFVCVCVCRESRDMQDVSSANISGRYTSRGCYDCGSVEIVPRAENKNCQRCQRRIISGDNLCKDARKTTNGGATKVSRVHVRFCHARLSLVFRGTLRVRMIIIKSRNMLPPTLCSICVLAEELRAQHARVFTYYSYNTSENCPPEFLSLFVEVNEGYLLSIHGRGAVVCRKTKTKLYTTIRT